MTGFGKTGLHRLGQLSRRPGPTQRDFHRRDQRSNRRAKLMRCIGQKPPSLLKGPAQSLKHLIAATRHCMKLDRQCFRIDPTIEF